MLVTSSNVVNDVIVVLGVLGSVFGFAKSNKFKQFMGFVKKEEPIIAQALDGVLHSPAAKVVQAKLDHELNVANDALKQSALAQYAFAVLRGAKKTYDQMSQPEKASAIRFVLAHMPQGMKVTESEVVDTLNNVEKLAEEYANSDVFKQALAFAQTLANTAQPQA